MRGLLMCATREKWRPNLARVLETEYTGFWLDIRPSHVQSNNSVSTRCPYYAAQHFPCYCESAYVLGHTKDWEPVFWDGCKQNYPTGATRFPELFHLTIPAGTETFSRVHVLRKRSTSHVRTPVIVSTFANRWTLEREGQKLLVEQNYIYWTEPPSPRFFLQTSELFHSCMVETYCQAAISLRNISSYSCTAQ